MITPRNYKTDNRRKRDGGLPVNISTSATFAETPSSETNELVTVLTANTKQSLNAPALRVSKKGNNTMKPNDSWIVKVRRTVISELVVNGCDEETARNKPYDHCDQETDMEQEDYEVLSVEENV